MAARVKTTLKGIRAAHRQKLRTRKVVKDRAAVLASKLPQSIARIPDA